MASDFSNLGLFRNKTNNQLSSALVLCDKVITEDGTLGVLMISQSSTDHIILTGK